MKRFVAMTILGMTVAVGGAALARAQTPAEVTEAELNARVDARLKQVLAELCRRVQHGQEIALADR